MRAHPQTLRPPGHPYKRIPEQVSGFGLGAGGQVAGLEGTRQLEAQWLGGWSQVVQWLARGWKRSEPKADADFRPSNQPLKAAKALPDAPSKYVKLYNRWEDLTLGNPQP